MTIESRAVTILRDTEAGLRQLAAEAVSAGDYAGIIKIAALAKTISELVRSTSLEGSTRNVSVAPKANRAGKAVGPTRRPSTRPVERKEFPRFFRREDQLIRIAWSKREKKEYSHKVPYAALKALVEAFAKAGREGRVFTTDQVLPIRDLADGSEIPNYQSYVCISWLKQTGLIDQHGRQGYSVPRLTEFQNAVESIWLTLPKQ